MVSDVVVNEWIAKADEDYFFTKKHIQSEDSFFAPLCFHCQQAVEKYLKAYLISHEQPLRKTHDLVDLIRMCVLVDISFEEIREFAVLLNPYYVDTRYPAVWPVGSSQQEAYVALEAAGRIREFILEKLKTHASPAE